MSRDRRDPPTPEEAMAIIRADTPVNRKQQMQREVAKGNRGQRGNRDKKDKRDKIESDVQRDTGLSKEQMDVTLVEMYDELADFGVLRRRNVDRRAVRRPS